MKKPAVLMIALALIVLLSGCDMLNKLLGNKDDEGEKDLVTGVTITGPGVSTGLGDNKEITVTKDEPVQLDVTITKSGNPDVTEHWESDDETFVIVDESTGEITGLAATDDGVEVTVTVGTKTAGILVKVVEETPGLTLEFDTDVLEFQTITATAGTTPPTVVKTDSDIIMLSNTDGTFKQTTSDSIQGSSYLLYKTPIEGSFEVKAAVKVTWAASGDSKICGVGMFTTDANGEVTSITDPTTVITAESSKAAVLVKRNRSTNDIRSLWSKANNTTGYLGAGSPNLAPITLGDYHIFSVKRYGGKFYFDAVGESISGSASVGIAGQVEGGEIYSTLSGAGKVGIVFAGVTAEVEGFTVNELNDDGTFKSELYSSGTLPPMDISVYSIDVTGPEGSVQSATVDMASGTQTIQLATAYNPSVATIGNSVTYTVSEGDTNVSVDTDGLVTVTSDLTSDGTATITATSGNTRTDTYVLTLIDSSLPVTSVQIPSTLTIASGQTLTLSPVTVLPAIASDKSVTWASSNTSVITVNETTGAISVASGALVGQSAVVTAQSVKTSTVTSNNCTVTVGSANADAVVYTFPTANWGTNASSLLASTATSDGTVNFAALGTATTHTDGLSYKSAGAGNIRMRYVAATGNVINYNGSSFLANTVVFPAAGQPVGDPTNTAVLGTDGAVRAYIAVPLNAVSAPNVRIDIVFRPTGTVANQKIGLIGSDYLALDSQVIDVSFTTDRTYTWQGVKGSLSSVLVAFSRENTGSSGGIDVRSITVTPIP